MLKPMFSYTRAQADHSLPWRGFSAGRRRFPRACPGAWHHGTTPLGPAARVQTGKRSGFWGATRRVAWTGWEQRRPGEVRRRDQVRGLLRVFRRGPGMQGAVALRASVLSTAVYRTGAREGDHGYTPE